MMIIDERIHVFPLLGYDANPNYHRIIIYNSEQLFNIMIFTNFTS